MLTRIAYQSLSTIDEFLVPLKQYEVGSHKVKDRRAIRFTKEDFEDEEVKAASLSEEE